jgi:IS30 family transposase
MNREAENEIVHRWQNHQSLRSIARELNLSRYQVARIIQSHTKHRDAQAASENDSPPASLGSAPRRRSSKLDPYADAILQLLERYPRITVLGVRPQKTRKTTHRSF